MIAFRDLPASVPGAPHDPGAVDLWCFFYDDDLGALDALAGLMSPAEAKRHRTLRFAKDRHLYVATRVLVRSVLARYTGIAPADLRFGEGEHGKPHLDAPGLPEPLSFNLANTAGLVVCAVSRGVELLGVDVEALEDPRDRLGIADRFFAPAEVRELRALPEAAQRERFFRLWTLKESYLKARGLGLGVPLDQLCFAFPEAAAPRITLDPRLGDDAERWRFEQVAVDGSHLLAVAAATDGAPLVLAGARWTPPTL